MSSRKSKSAGNAVKIVDGLDGLPSSGSFDVWPVENLNRLAQLVAKGVVAFPTNLSGADEDRLLQAVQRHRRDRLIRFVARCIAQEIWRMRDHE